MKGIILLTQSLAQVIVYEMTENLHPLARGGGGTQELLPFKSGSPMEIPPFLGHPSVHDEAISNDAYSNDDMDGVRQPPCVEDCVDPIEVFGAHDIHNPLEFHNAILSRWGLVPEPIIWHRTGHPCIGQCQIKGLAGYAVKELIILSYNNKILSNSVIVGIDEAGRGPLAGPVVAGACHISQELFRRRRAFGAWSPWKRKPAHDVIIADSKALEPSAREIAYAWITAHCAFGFGMSSQQDIDRFGILAATESAMQAALRMLATKITPTYVLVDGRDHFWFDYPHSSIIRGDGSEPCIAAASIVAKATRDRLMIEHAKLFPQYGFEHHKGYGTPEHLEAIQRFGPCELHRQSYLRTILPNAEQERALSRI